MRGSASGQAECVLLTSGAQFYLGMTTREATPRPKCVASLSRLSHRLRRLFPGAGRFKPNIGSRRRQRLAGVALIIKSHR